MRVSIIVTCYNRERFVSRAIRSAISQRFPRNDFEVIVVDDGSTDHSRNIIKDFGDEIVPIFNRKNQGLPAARNAGIRRARGRFVLHLDSDDYLHEDLIHLEQLHLAMNLNWGAVSCDYYVVDVNERHLERHSGVERPIACGIMFRKENLIKIGLYNERMRLCEDEELRVRYEQLHEIGNVALPLYRYTRHDGNLTNDIKSVEKYRRRLSRSPAKRKR
jgi:glycosyltransferase involved in cell wall biosynthesis